MIKIHPTEELVEEASGAQAHAAADEHIPEHVQLASSLARKPHVMLITGFCIIRIIEYDKKDQMIKLPVIWQGSHVFLKSLQGELKTSLWCLW